MVVYGCCGRVAYERDCELSFFFLEGRGQFFCFLNRKREGAFFYLFAFGDF
jgi:hypothetical protein